MSWMCLAKSDVRSPRNLWRLVNVYTNGGLDITQHRWASNSLRIWAATYVTRSGSGSPGSNKTQFVHGNWEPHGRAGLGPLQMIRSTPLPRMTFLRLRYYIPRALGKTFHCNSAFIRMRILLSALRPILSIWPGYLVGSHLSITRPAPDHNTAPSFFEKNTEISITSPNTLSEQSLQRVEGWLSGCVRLHGTCNRRTSNTLWYPTRLLQIGRLDDGEYHVRLIHTVKEQSYGPYFTLSHRWGDANFTKLTKHTITSFGQTIMIENLPQTFVDAIFVTLRLGVHYLWIDSLCIMQDEDDLSDWLREAALMHKVYSYSHCNISASVSERGSEGLSRNRDPRKLYGPVVELTTEDFMNAVSTDCEIRYDHLWRSNVADSHINTRGWVSSSRYGSFDISLSVDVQDTR
jgi:hypothetical protein